MQLKDIRRRRLHNQQLTRPNIKKPVEAVAWSGAVQAQDYGAAKWALGQRLVGATDASLDRAFDAGEMLRTHVMRPTWHFVAPADIRWLLALTGPRVKAISAYYSRQYGLDDATIRRSRKILTKALKGRQYQTRDALSKLLKEAGIAREGLALAYIIIHAELDALICSGPRRGKQFTYALLEERVPPAKPLTRDEALAELVKRYFTSHGPAQVQDFVWWSGLTVADTKAGLSMVKSQLEQETVDGKAYWLTPNAPSPMPALTYLLPNYDEYTVAYKDRGAFFDSKYLPQLDTRDSSVFWNMIVVGGSIIGTWKRTIAKNSVALEYKLFETPTAGRMRGFNAAVKRLGAFLNLPVVVEPA